MDLLFSLYHQTQSTRFYSQSQAPVACAFLELSFFVFVRAYSILVHNFPSLLFHSVNSISKLIDQASSFVQACVAIPLLRLLFKSTPLSIACHNLSIPTRWNLASCTAIHNCQTLSPARARPDRILSSNHRIFQRVGKCITTPPASAKHCIVERSSRIRDRLDRK